MFCLHLPRANGQSFCRTSVGIQASKLHALNTAFCRRGQHARHAFPNTIPSAVLYSLSPILISACHSWYHGCPGTVHSGGCSGTSAEDESDEYPTNDTPLLHLPASPNVRDPPRGALAHQDDSSGCTGHISYIRSGKAVLYKAQLSCTLFARP